MKFTTVFHLFFLFIHLCAHLPTLNPLYLFAGNDDNYFSLDEVTGELSVPNAIDREQLITPFFNLVIKAFEVLSNGSNAPDPSTSEQVCPF